MKRRLTINGKTWPMPIGTASPPRKRVTKPVVLAPETGSGDLTPLPSRLAYAKTIGALWKEAETTFLTIGRYLALARATLPHGEYEAMVRDDLLMGPAVARKLRTVAESIDSGSLPVQDLPPNYTTIYLIATLPADVRVQAQREGLIHPEVRRNEIEAFRRRMVSTGLSRHDRLRQERIRLLTRLREIEAELSVGNDGTEETSKPP
jgi:hypothetical protein